ncbi:MAG TPA: DUF1570 domain-containing protein [Polyangiaceae bacterium]|nr:DUF1570 domain-containing protein [Polyangiaceae bacterium]
MRYALLPLLLLGPGCGHYQMACPVAGGPQWIEATSSHFTMRTDLPAADAEKMLREDEETLAQFTLVADFFLPATAAMGRRSLVVFAKQWEYQKLVTPEQQGYGFVEVGRFVAHDERGRATIALSTEKQAEEVFRHELAHRLLHQRVGDVPQWLDEGFAEYFSVLPVVDDKIMLGGPTVRLHQFNNGFQRNESVERQQLYAQPTAQLKEILDGDKLGSYSSVGYFVAWLLVHYLANGAPEHADRFRHFLRALVNGQPWAKALTADYGTLPAIEEACQKHLLQMADNETLQWSIRYTPPPPSEWRVATRVLDDGEVHHLKASLRPTTEAEELKLATLHAPKSAELHRWVANRAAARHDDGAAEREIATATTLTSDPFYRVERARIELERELRKPEAERHLDTLQDEIRAAARYAGEPEQLSGLAHYYELTHDYVFGTTLAARAVAMDPRCASCLLTLASLYFASGKTADAAVTLESAVHRWPVKTVPAEVTARLKEYRCTLAREKGATCAPCVGVENAKSSGPSYVSRKALRPSVSAFPGRTPPARTLFRPRNPTSAWLGVRPSLRRPT